MKIIRLLAILIVYMNTSNLFSQTVSIPHLKMTGDQFNSLLETRNIRHIKFSFKVDAGQTPSSITLIAYSSTRHRSKTKNSQFEKSVEPSILNKSKLIDTIFALGNLEISLKKRTDSTSSIKHLLKKGDSIDHVELVPELVTFSEKLVLTYRIYFYRKQSSDTETYLAPVSTILNPSPPATAF